MTAHDEEMIHNLMMALQDIVIENPTCEHIDSNIDEKEKC